jgi:NADH dehydrogenase
MILVTGATGFIGRSLVRELSEAGYPLRALIRPSRRSPRLPRGIPVEVAVVSLADTRGLRAALNDVDVIFHLASAEWHGRHANLRTTDIEGTRNLVEAAADAGVERFVFLSHLGAARASAYPVFRAKGIAEETIRRSSIPYTIIRSSIVYGPEDHFTTGLARLLRISPGFFFLPGGGRTVIQPFWVEDLVACLLWSLENPETVNQVYELGGSEYFTVRQVLEILMPILHTPRLLVELPIVMLRALVVFLESVIPGFPASSFWIDYSSISRTCAADSTPRAFGLMPARFTYRLDYLAYKPWWKRLALAVSERRERARAWLRRRMPRRPGG